MDVIAVLDELREVIEQVDYSSAGIDLMHVYDLAPPNAELPAVIVQWLPIRYHQTLGGGCEIDLTVTPVVSTTDLRQAQVMLARLAAPELIPLAVLSHRSDLIVGAEFADEFAHAGNPRLVAVGNAAGFGFDLTFTVGTR